MNVGGGGALNFFLVGVCGPDFRSGGLWTDNCLWKGGLLNWKFPNLGACELKISNFGGLWTENFQIWGLESENFPFFLKRGAFELRLLLEMGPLWTTGEAWKGGLQDSTSPYPLSRSVTSPGGLIMFLGFNFMFDWSLFVNGSSQEIRQYYMLAKDRILTETTHHYINPPPTYSVVRSYLKTLWKITARQGAMRAICCGKDCSQNLLISARQK